MILEIYRRIHNFSLTFFKIELRLRLKPNAGGSFPLVQALGSGT